MKRRMICRYFITISKKRKIIFIEYIYIYIYLSLLSNINPNYSLIFKLIESHIKLGFYKVENS